MQYVTPSGHVVLIDDDVILPGRLSIGSHGYAQMYGGEQGRTILLHRWLLGLVVGDPRVGDHINRWPLDCRMENLRIVTPTGSNLNRAAPERGLPTHIYGTDAGRFTVAIKRNRKITHFGTYASLEEAVGVRDLALEGSLMLFPTKELVDIRTELKAIKLLLVQLIKVQTSIGVQAGALEPPPAQPEEWASEVF